MKKLTCLFLALIVMISMLPCLAAAEEPDLYAVPDLTGVTIRIMTNSSITSGVDYATILPRWRQVEERTGCKIIWEVIDSDYSTVLNTRLSGAANDESPDIVIAGKVTGASSYIEDGLFYELTQCFDICPNMKKFYTETNTEMASLMTYIDGGIYQMASSTFVTYEDFLKYSGESIENCLWYRSDLAEQLGFTEPPVTVDDWYNMLCAAKEAYPDMYIFDTKKVHGSWSSLSILAGCYGLQMNHNNAANYFAVNDEGQIIYEPTLEACKAWLAESNRWYTAGLIHEGNSTSQLYTNGAAGLTFASFWRGMRNHVTELLAANPDITYIACPTPIAEGYNRHFAARDPYGDTYAIVDNGDEEHCRKVAQFLDYAVYSPYGIACERFGAEGFVWSFDENHNIVLADDAATHTSIEMNASGSYMWSKFPSVYSYDLNMLHASIIGGEDDSAIDPRLLEYEKTALAATVENMSLATPIFVVPYMSEEDQAEVAFLLTDLQTFTNEMFTAYILGNKSLDNYQTEFVDKLYDTFQLQKLLDIYQKYV